MSQKSLRKFLNGPGRRGPVVRGRTPQVVDVEQKADEDLSALGEMEDEAKDEEVTAEQDNAELAEGNVPGSIAGERPPMGFSTGGID